MMMIECFLASPDLDGHVGLVVSSVALKVEHDILTSNVGLGIILLGVINQKFLNHGVWIICARLLVKNVSWDKYGSTIRFTSAKPPEE